MHNDGVINFDEFLNFMAQKLKDSEAKEELNDAFDLFDHDRDGLISATEMRQVMENLGESLSDAEFSEIIRAIGVTRNGHIKKD